MRKEPGRVRSDAVPVAEASAPQLVAGGKTVYGIGLGIMMLDTMFPRIPGDVGNAGTWPFPVAYRVVRDALPERMAVADSDPALLGPFLEAARELEGLGVPAIITSCGFLAAHQQQLSAAVSVPVFASSLLQVPMAASCVGPSQRVVIFTARTVLNESHFAGAGWSEKDVSVIQAAPALDSHFYEVFVGNALDANVSWLEREVAELTERVMLERGDVGAIVLECANFSPFRGIVNRVAGVPVFDLYTLGMQAFLTTTTDDVSRRGTLHHRAP